MEQIRLFQRTPPSPGGETPVNVDVPERYRAELFRVELESTRRLFDGYAQRHPAVSEALGSVRLLGTLALVLDDYVAPGVVADINVFSENAYPGRPIALEDYKRYVAAMLERAADPYRLAASWETATQTSSDGAWRGLQAFYRRYPMIRSMVDAATQNFQQSILRCCDRVLEDWPDLQTFFFGGTVLNKLVRIETTGSDFHKGGGQVVILTFCDAVLQERRLVYKPTDVERDLRCVGDTAALAAALPNLQVVTNKGVTALILLNNAAGSLGEMLTAQAALTGSAYTVPVYHILPVWPGSALAAVNGAVPIRKSYGYLEFLTSDAADNQFATPQQRQQFYKSFGAEVALCWVFQIIDLHQGNLIVHDRLPYLIDLEMACTGIMESPSNTNLGQAYGRFTVPDPQRAVEVWNSRLSYLPAARRLPTKNALYDTAGTLVAPGAADRYQVSQAFINSVDLIMHNLAAYDAWILAAQHVVTRILPFGTDLLQALAQGLNDPASPQSSVVFPEQIELKTLGFGRDEIGNGWGANFLVAALAAAGSAPALNLGYDAIAPKFAFWFDPRTAADFAAGDIPTYYQKMDTPQALNSVGDFVPVTYDSAIQATAAVSQQPLANALVTLWGTPPPLLPATYLTGNAFQILRDYLNALHLNVGNFRRTREAAGAVDINQW
jgi:Domain of unknown function (DUF4135)